MSEAGLLLTRLFIVHFKNEIPFDRVHLLFPPSLAGLDHWFSAFRFRLRSCFRKVPSRFVFASLSKVGGKDE